MFARIAAGVVLVLPLAACGSDDPGEPSPSPTVSESAAVEPSATATTEPAGKPNGVDGLGPAKILQQARKAAKNARSVRTIGTSPDASIDLVTTASAAEGERTSGDATLTTRSLEGTVYIKASPEYWTEAFSKKAAKKIGDKWVVGELSNPKLESFASTRSTAVLMKNFLVLGEAPQVGEVGEALGQPAVPVTSSNGVLWIATTGKPYPLLLTSTTEQADGSEVEFTEWDKKVVIKAPPQKNTIDLAELA